MTARTSRIQRRAAERPNPELASQAAPAQNESSADSSTFESSARRIEANRVNAQHSTGPRTAEGKAKSSRNSFKHGLYATHLVLTGEDPAKLEALRLDLRAEHQPANTAEEILVNELAENFWRLRRMRSFEAQALQPENVHAWMNHGLVTLVQRTMASAGRSFYKTLSTLRQMQKDRGFVPAIPQSQVSTGADTALPPAEEPTQLHAGEEFLLQTPAAHGFVSQKHELRLPIDPADDKKPLRFKCKAS